MIELKECPCPQNVGDGVRNRMSHLLGSTGMTTNRFCKITGIPQETISSVMNGRSNASIVTIKWLCDSFGITLSDFFNSKEFENTKGDKNKDGKAYWVYG